uniref:AMP-binding enzyme n=1 Tax=Candidatus Kentrum sp. LPFa TaxID=2126335 RepID=A0A450WFG5_9GAMM|nr:MAG: AMP-binding enzyme [Candidatus Kentron sp. LPFa]VFK31508.1 MAG: AMP-binding enzyme [Candidatus Kentron sp. LPFa]
MIRYWQQSQETDIQLWLMNLPNNQYGIWQYAPDLFNRSTIKRWSGHFLRLLEGIVAEPETEISRLPLLTEAEQHRILVEWNDTKAPYPAGKCVHKLFEEQAARTPDAVAVVFSSASLGQVRDEEVSYGELNARANRLAHRLQAMGVGSEVLVGLLVERSVEIVVGLLAILRAGGAYVPLDPEYPEERLTFMAGDADLKALLCHGATRERLPECSARILDMDGEAAAIAGESPKNPARLAGPENLAYVIYTSGSTGTAVIAELRRGTGETVEQRLSLLNNVELLKVTSYIDDIANIYIKKRLMPNDPNGDALHLAVASVYRVDVLLTWNCKHLANPSKMEHIRAVNYGLGLPMLLLTTPLNYLSGE